MANQNAQLAELTQRINADPVLREAITRSFNAPYNNGFFWYDPKTRQPLPRDQQEYYNAHPQEGSQGLQSILKKNGLSLPGNNKDYSIAMDPATGDFSVTRDSWWDRNQDWAIPAMLVGGGVAGAALGPGIGGASAATNSAATGGVAGGVGLGETGAVTGLGGSGFAGSAGGIGATTVGAGGAAIPVAGSAAASTIPPVVKAATNTGTDVAKDAATHTGTKTAAEIAEDIAKKAATDKGLDYTSLLLGGIGSALNAWSASQNAPQKRQSFRGTAADPVDLLSGAMKAIGSEGDTLRDQQAQAQQRGPVVGATPGSLPTFTGGGLPMPIGVRRNTTPPPQPLSSQPATADELDHLYSSLSLLGGKR